MIKKVYHIKNIITILVDLNKKFEKNVSIESEQSKNLIWLNSLLFLIVFSYNNFHKKSYKLFFFNKKLIKFLIGPK